MKLSFKILIITGFMVIFIFMMSLFSGCCNFCNKSTKIERDTLHFAVHDTTNFITTPQLKFLSDSMIQFHPFEVKFDTVLNYKFLDRIKTDTLKIRYSFPDNELQVADNWKTDTLTVYKEKTSEVIEKTKSFWETLKDQFIAWILILAIGGIGGFTLKR